MRRKHAKSKLLLIVFIDVSKNRTGLASHLDGEFSPRIW
jgi:hypothetical protein